MDNVENRTPIPLSPSLVFHTNWSNSVFLEFMITVVEILYEKSKIIFEKPRKII
jgi:hypothetical protein